MNDSLTTRTVSTSLRLAVSVSAMLALVAGCTSFKESVRSADQQFARMLGQRPHETQPVEPVTRGPGQEAYERGVKYMQGDGVKRDPKKAVEWLRIAADKGHPDAEFLLGLAYQAGDGVARDDAQAARLFERAARRNHTEAQFLLGLAYLRGRGVAEDAAKAAEWFRRAATAGGAGAQYNLGTLYMTGRGVPQDNKKALDWLSRAAGQGYPEAQYLVGSAYTSGRGTKPDHAWAAMWYGLAAEQGVVPAQYMLGVSYAGGLGLPHADEDAYFWIKVAADKGSKEARRILNGARKRLAADQVAAADDKAAHWTPHAKSGPQAPPVVRFVQYRLWKLNYDPGPIDGLPGPRTLDALDKFRRTAGLPTGGTITARDLERLRKDADAK